MTRYTAEIGGSTWSRGPRLPADTIREARLLAEDYGATADYCHIYNERGVLVAAHHRDTSGDGTRWFRGCAPLRGDTLRRCTICGFVVDTAYAAEKPVS